MNSSSLKNKSTLFITYPLEHRSSAEVVAETSVGCILFLLGVIGNSLVCFVIHKKRFSNSSMYYFMLNLAYADLLVCFISIPLTLLSTRPEPFIVEFGSMSCKLIRFVQYILPPASVAILTATAVDRYFHICIPLKKMITTKSTKQLAALCWTSALILTLPIFYLIETQKVMYGGVIYEFCNIEETSTYPTAGMVYLVIRGCLGFAIPLAMVSVLYFKIVQTVWKRQSRHRLANRQRGNVVKSLLTVVIAFSLSWTPFSITNKYFLFTLPRREFITRQEIICFWIGLTASVYNPIIYAFYNKQFRNAFVSLALGKKRARMSQAALKAAQVSYRSRSKTLPAFLLLENKRQVVEREFKEAAEMKSRHLSLGLNILEDRGSRYCLSATNRANPGSNQPQTMLANHELHKITAIATNLTGKEKRYSPNEWYSPLKKEILKQEAISPNINEIPAVNAVKNNCCRARATETNCRDIFQPHKIMVEPKKEQSPRNSLQRSLVTDGKILNTKESE